MTEENGLDAVPVNVHTGNEVSSTAGMNENPASGGEPPSQQPGSSSTGKKKKKKRHEKADKQDPQSQSDTKPAEKALSLKTMRNMLAAIEKDSQPDPTTKTWKFWDTQPVPKMGDKIDEVGVIEADKDHVREEPYSLPAGFEWDTIDLGVAKQLEEVYKLLNENYVEDEDNMFRFDYSAEFLQWALRPPGWKADWHCGVRVTKSKKLVGFISAIPALIKVYEAQQKMVEINFLCVHKKLRSKRVAPVLIREITRRVNLEGVFQAVYTAGVVLPKPIAKCRYYHRSLNPRKLVDVKFSHLGRNQTMQRLTKLMRLPEKPLIKGFRAMEEKDIPQCHQLLSKYLDTFSLAPVFTQEEFAHFFSTRKGIVHSFVVEDDDGEITEMSSFFSLPSSIMQHPEHNMLYAAYSFYSVATKHSLKDLMKDMLIVAKSLGYDVYNALDLMENQSFLKDLKFGMGDGNLNYYLYNFKCPYIPENKVALVLQ